MTKISAIYTLFLVPKNDVDYVITEDGTLKMSWLKKIANYEETTSVEMTFNISGFNQTFEHVTGNESLGRVTGSRSFGHVTGNAKETSLYSLRFGETYQVSLRCLVSNETVGPFVIEACKFLKFFAYNFSIEHFVYYLNS